MTYFLRSQVNYNDGGIVDRPEDTTWQENLSDYNSDFSAPSGTLEITTYICTLLNLLVRE